MRVYLESLGCKLNQCERDALAGEFVCAGHRVVERIQDADVCVINTCAVTHVAAGKSRRRVRQLQRLNPAARFVATGCYTGMRQNGMHVDLAVSNDAKDELVSLVEARLPGWDLPVVDRPERDDVPLTVFAGSRTRPLVKIQDGCDNACAYCIIHILRGPQRSRPRQEILDRVASLVAAGYREVVLTGVHVGSYGRDSGDSLTALVQEILARSPPDRLRLSSIEPWDLAPDFLVLWQDPRLCRHLHLPLQSGCDATLARMNRHYTTAQYARLVERARAAVPGLAVTTDLIVGFPGESGDEFALSKAFVEQMAFARVHVFPYSPRPGTPAADMPAQVDPQVRHRRAREMRCVARRSSEAFRRRFLGQRMPVLWESRRYDGRWSGLTDNYIRVYVESDRGLLGILGPARLLALETGGVRGELCSG